MVRRDLFKAEYIRFVEEMKSLQHVRGDYIASMRQTVMKTRESIDDSRELMLRVDARLARR